MIDRLDSELNVQRKALSLRAYQQELLASNIANADTPNYKAKDIDFKSALSGALSGRGVGGVGLAQTQSGHMSGSGTGPLGAQVKYRTEWQGAVDGNTVNMDIERSAFTENAIHMEALLTFMRSHIKDLQTAIQGQ